MATNLSLVLMLLWCATTAHCILEVWVIRAIGLPAKPDGPINSYVSVLCSGTAMGETSIQEDTGNPLWNEKFYRSGVLANSPLLLQIYDRVGSGDVPLGSCRTTLRWGSKSGNCNLIAGGVLFYHYNLS